MSTERPEAFAFECSLSLEARSRALNEMGPWRWSGTDSDTSGDPVRL